jgi:4a-hydroxytetrahydrobiopterin dehydratase
MWENKDNKLVREFVFKDFREAFAFMVNVAFIAEELGHHPNWTNVYNKVSFELFTHDAGNIVTPKDKELAKRIDELID